MPLNLSRSRTPTTTTIRYGGDSNSVASPPSNGCSGFDDNTVATWADTSANVPLEIWRQLTEPQQKHVITRERDRNGIVQPKGYDVSFHYNARVEAHHFGSQHPMKPWRLTLTKQLIFSYGLHYALKMFESRMASADELATFHSADYLEFLARLNPRNELEKDEKEKYLGDEQTSLDCPLFDGMWDYFRYYSGATLDGACKLNQGQSDIAISWSGGLHHAHKTRAAGFCYINDIVIAIQELLKFHQRVLYIDIDVHHGDGVEEAFYSECRVMTLSFHNFFPAFFPGTGDKDETGPKENSNPGAHHSLNVPLLPGITDDQWIRVFDNITGPVINDFNPSAIVLQCGADSLGGDRLGPFNLNIKAHGHCVQFVKDKSHNRKLLILGGGGYTPRNVARCWTHETAICVGATLRNEIPGHLPYRQAFTGAAHGDAKLYPMFETRWHENKNTDEHLDSVIGNIHTQLRFLQGAPSVQMQRIPGDHLKIRQDEDAKMEEEAADRGEDDYFRQTKESGEGVQGEMDVS